MILTSVNAEREPLQPPPSDVLERTLAHDAKVISTAPGRLHHDSLCRSWLKAPPGRWFTLAGALTILPYLGFNMRRARHRFPPSDEQRAKEPPDAEPIRSVLQFSSEFESGNLARGVWLPRHTCSSHSHSLPATLVGENEYDLAMSIDHQAQGKWDGGQWFYFRVQGGKPSVRYRLNVVLPPLIMVCHSSVVCMGGEFFQGGLVV